jgi:hypothetical protein
MQQACPFELEGVVRRPPIARMWLIVVLPAHEFTFAFDRSMSAAALTPDNPSLGFELFGLTKLTGGFLDLGRVNHSRPGSFFASIFIFCPSSVRVPPVLRAAAMLSRREERPLAAPLNGDNFRRNFGRARKQSPVHHACVEKKAIEPVEESGQPFRSSRRR